MNILHTVIFSLCLSVACLQASSSSPALALVREITDEDVRAAGQQYSKDLAGATKDVLNSYVHELCMPGRLITEDRDGVVALAGAGADVTTPAFYHLLRKAVKAEDDSLTEFLLRKGVNPNITGVIEWPILLDCTKLSTLQLLLIHRVDVTAKDPELSTCLHYLVSRTYMLPDEEEMIALLLASGAELNAKDVRGRTPLVCAVAKRRNIEIVKKRVHALLAPGAETHRCFEGKTAAALLRERADEYDTQAHKEPFYALADFIESNLGNLD